MSQTDTTVTLSPSQLEKFSLVTMHHRNAEMAQSMTEESIGSSQGHNYDYYQSLKFRDHILTGNPEDSDDVGDAEVRAAFLMWLEFRFQQEKRLLEELIYISSQLEELAPYNGRSTIDSVDPYGFPNEDLWGKREEAKRLRDRRNELKTLTSVRVLNYVPYAEQHK